jgi:hypothetical protein
MFLLFEILLKNFFVVILTLLVQYSVVLFPPDIIGFHFDPSSSSLQKGDILLAQPVEITTAFATGPRPRMYAPPQYESSFPGRTLVGDRISGLFQ